jgi:serine/threonine-protein kinase HipA
VSDTLAVVLDEAVAGMLTRLNGGKLRFDYADDYRARESSTPLSLSMPTQVQSHPDSAITPWPWGLLPDNEAVLARWARHFHVSASSPFSLLATPVGEDCAGAVRFCAPAALDRVLHRSGDVFLLDDDEVAERLGELREDSTAWLGKSFSGQFSLAGTQSKTALLFQDGRWGSRRDPSRPRTS